MTRRLRAFAGLTHFGGNAVSAVDDAFALRHLVDAVDKDRTLAANSFQLLKAVMDDLFTDIDGPPKCLERNPDNVDSARTTPQAQKPRGFKTQKALGR